MKKKILLLTFLIFITSLPLMAFSMDIAPYEGSFGVPLGSDDYDGGYNGFDDTPDPENDDGIYNDSEIVAIAEFQDITATDVASSSGQEVKITVSCPNGMFFVSQSNPAFKFPFELQLIWTDESDYDGWTRYTRTVQRTRSQTREWNGWGWGDWGAWSEWSISEEEWEKYKYSTYDGWNNIKPDEDDSWFPDKPESQQKEWYTSKNSNVSEQNPEYILQFRVSDSNEFVVQEQGDVEPSEFGGFGSQKTQIEKITQIGYMYNGFNQMDLWADIVLVLPGTVANDTVTYNNVVYPLIEADDYTALVTMTMEYGGQIKSITIPFSGFYEKGNTYKEESVCSLLVNPYSTAAHLSIAEDRGTWVPVGSLDFMLSTATNTNTTNPVIFASSSSNPGPEADTADEFRLVHESATFNTPLTQTNSIGFDVRIRNLNADRGTSSYIFDGTATQKSVTNKLNGLSYDTDTDSGNQYPLSGDWGGIVPAKIYSKLQHDNAEKSYYLYNGEIEVMMDPGTNVMLEGRYTGTVYIHVIANEVTTSG